MFLGIWRYCMTHIAVCVLKVAAISEICSQMCFWFDSKLMRMMLCDSLNCTELYCAGFLVFTDLRAVWATAGRKWMPNVPLLRLWRVVQAGNRLLCKGCVLLSLFLFPIEHFFLSYNWISLLSHSATLILVGADAQQSSRERIGVTLDWNSLA